MKIILLTIIALSNLLILPTSSIKAANISTSIYENVNPKLIYPDNHGKSFISEDEFYSTLDKNIYEEYINAAFSMRQKITFKDLPDIEEVFNQKTRNAYKKMNLQKQTHVDPNRQVYFFASFHQNETEEFHKFVVIDAETQVELMGGNSYHKYFNPYK